MKHVDHKIGPWSDDLLKCHTTELHQFLERPTLFEIPGRPGKPLFVSTLLHGNETSGFLALQRLFKNYKLKDRELPRPIIVLLGNIRAAKSGKRHLADQLDYNRIWEGEGKPEHEMAKEVFEFVKQKDPFACVDVHNTTGKNPHYACINHLDHNSIYLASLFSKNVVYFVEPSEVLSNKFSQLCPSITVESGLSGEGAGIELVESLVSGCLHMREFPAFSDDKIDAQLFHSLARIFVPEKCKIGFGEACENVDFCFIEDLDDLNFSELPPGTVIGKRINPKMQLYVKKETGEDLSDDFFTYDNGEIRVRKPIIPSLFTKEVNIIRKDCLGYIMSTLKTPSS